MDFFKFNYFLDRSPSCNDNYLEIRKTSQNGPLVGVYCGKEVPANLDASQSYWIKYQTDATSTSNGFLAEYKYLSHSDLDGSTGTIESPNYPKYLTTNLISTYRISVAQGSVIRIEFPFFFMDEEDEDDCFGFLKIFNGYDETAPLLQDEMCSETPSPLTSETNVIYMEAVNNHMSRTKFQITWKEVNKVRNNTNVIESGCGDKVISLNNDTDIVNITSPGYPFGYDSGLSCTWTIMSTLPSFHPIVVFKDIDLEDISGCLGDYVAISADRDDGSWKELDKVCALDIRERKTFDGTPNLMLKFKTDYGINRTGFHAYTVLECGGKMTESEGLIEYNTSQLFRGFRTLNDCMWNITVRRGKTIQFEFLDIDIHNTSNTCNNAYVTIRNGIDDASPYLGEGQYCGRTPPKVPPTSSNRAFVKFKINLPKLNSFRIRYHEVQHECGGQLRLMRSNSSVIISSPNNPNIPPPHIECTWTILAPIGEQLRVDFVGRLDLTFSPTCEKEFVELREGSTSSSQLIGTFCGTAPTTKYSKSNVLFVKFFTDVAEPKGGFKANISIGVCGGMQRSNAGFLTSPKYPGLGAYPSQANCDYRIVGLLNNIFNITIIDIDLPPINGTECDRAQDHIVIFSIIPDFNATQDETLIEQGVYCGSQPPNSSFQSDSNEIMVRFNTFQKTKTLYKGFKLLFNVSQTACGGTINGDSGIITSPGYPTKTLNKLFCEWKITVPKGRRVKIEFLDVDLLSSKNQFLQRIGIYNDFRYSNRLKFITNNTIPDPYLSSDNRMMVTMWVRNPSQNRGFKLKFSSDDSTICEGSLNDANGQIFPPIGLNLTSYACDYLRDVVAIGGSSLNTGTIGYYFKDVSIGRKVSNCRYASTVVNVKRRSGQTDEEMSLARICGNATNQLTVLSPFPDITIEVRQNPFFGQINFTMNYKTHKCGGLILGGGINYIRMPPANTTSEKVLDCAWFSKYPDGFSIAILFRNLSLKLSCDREYINVFNGPTALSPSLGKFCGTEFTKESLVTQSNTVFIEYHTDNFIENSKNSAFEIKVESASYGCGGILTKNNFDFQTPLFGTDVNYPANTECIWEIRADPGYHIGLAFYDRFFLEASDNCTKDYVEVFDFVENDWKSLGRKCGRDPPQPFNSTAEKMKVIFRSDQSSGGDGFSAKWNQNCGGIFMVDQTMKILTSPGYPKAYGPMLTCNYTFVSTVPKAFINMNFLDFAVETTGTKCLYDNITIYKNPDYVYSFPVTPLKVGTYCGIVNPGQFRHREVSTVIFKTDRWVERSGFRIEYKLDDCGGVVTNSTMIYSPNIIVAPATYLGALHCTWNITAPVDKKIVVKFENFSMEHSDYCSFDYVELFNGSVLEDRFRLAKICGNLSFTITPIVIDNNLALIRLKTDQTNSYLGFSAAVYFMPKCDKTITLTADSPSYILDKSGQLYEENMECIFKVTAEPLSSINISFTAFHLSTCAPERNVSECNCDYLEVLDGNGPFSAIIGRYCGHDSPNNIITTTSAAYIRFVTDSVRQSTGFTATLTMIESPCGSVPYKNFTGNETDPDYILSPMGPDGKNYPANIRCSWIAEAPYGKVFEIEFSKFELEDSERCVNDSLTLEDNSVKAVVTEGLGEETIYRGKSSSSYQPSFYMGIAGPTSPHVYCGSNLPHEYISQSNKIKIHFETNSATELAGFNFTIKTIQSCARNYTALQGRIISADTPENCRQFIKVPENYTISLYFHKFFFYDSDCTKSFLKVYDGDFDSGVLMKTFCGYAMPDPIFSTKNQVSLVYKYDENGAFYSRGSYDILYVATDKGPGCGGDFYNYGGIFTSPFYPSSNRTFLDCTWTVTVPQNLKVAIRFASKGGVHLKRKIFIQHFLYQNILIRVRFDSLASTFNNELTLIFLCCFKISAFLTTFLFHKNVI